MKKKSTSVFHKKRTIVWAVSSGVLTAFLVTLTVLSNTGLYTVFSSLLGGKRAVYADGASAIYSADYDSKEDTLKASNKFNETIEEEGCVLLKNQDNTLPVYTKASTINPTSTMPKVSVFGKNSVDLAYGGTGSSGAMEGQLEDRVDLYAALKQAGYETNPSLKSFYESSNSGKKRTTSSDLDSGSTVVYSTAETPQNLYPQEVKDSYSLYSDLALVVITRQGGEGADMPRSMKGATGARDENDHFLQLDQNEIDLLDSVSNAGFKKIVVLFNIPSLMEVGFLTDPTCPGYHENIKAAIWMGYPGNTGTLGLARVLNGSTSPSGRTVDTWAKNFKENPTWNNFGEASEGMDTLRVNGKESKYHFVDYEENIYVGYKYYETRGYDEKASGNESWYANQVIYPFGYGLSYTSFQWDIVDVSSLEGKEIKPGETYDVKVRVTNIGTVPGKDVVELYGHAPYAYYGIEKPYVSLMDFEKTPLLYPSRDANDTDKPNSAIVTLTFDPYYLASYDDKDTNGNGFSGFELEDLNHETADSDYALFIAHNAHDYVKEVNFTLPQGGIRYAKDPLTGEDVVNRFTNNEDARYDSDYHIQATGSYLTRGDFKESFPTPVVSDGKDRREVSDTLISFMDQPVDTNFNRKTEEEVKFSQEKVLSYCEMAYNKGVYGFKDTQEDHSLPFTSYEDKRWDVLIASANEGELLNMINYGAFQSGAVNSIGKSLTNDTDGPSGFVNFMLKDGTYWGTCYYASQIVVSSTWNVDLAFDYGKMVGNEGIFGADGKGNAMPYSGWYAPGVNIHRSPFGGRNSEYCSEDSLLSGRIAAAQIRGCQSKGVYCFVKHFVANDQETHRSINGVSVWLSEQSLREIYLRPFEIVVKEGHSRAIMSSFNRIGGVWAGGDYRLLTDILRNEWGFRGTVISDFTSGDYMNARQMAYAGGDLNLNNQQKYAWNDYNGNSEEDKEVLKQCAKDVLYTVLNSNAMNGEVIGYKIPTWMVYLYVIDGVMSLLMAGWGFLAIYTAKKKIQSEEKLDQ